MYGMFLSFRYKIFMSITNELRVTGYVNRQSDERKILWLDIPWWIVYETAAVTVWAFLIFPSLVIQILSVNIPPVKTETRKSDAIMKALP